ncbi:YwhD family protein [Fodinisporobacter ferrooxydans]|uniref:YwhD family protein n=1 Tax=Fodinisporobacter ferrooxydans TaxID=2901836 RepID=A0ABY4CJJ3_9BACL|nr:YwhD family protein [Alicyclobacillaceae bacterium MYW30-H2]
MKKPKRAGECGMEMLNLTGRNKHAAPDHLPTLSSLIIDGEEVFIDNGAIHGKSRVEKGISFSGKEEDAPNGRRVCLVWITLRGTGDAKGYAGLTSCEMRIDDETKTGFKDLAKHVNQMDAAVKGKVDIQSLTKEEKQRLLQFLQTFRPPLWEHASPELKEVLGE